MQTGLKVARGFLVLVFSFCCVLTAGGEQRRRGPSVKTLAKGRELYISNCARCHGGDGLGKTKMGESVEAPDLTIASWQSKRSDTRLRNSIARGRGQMPGFSGKLSRADINALVAYVRKLRK